MSVKRLAVFGSTGSIGRQTLDIAAAKAADFSVAVMTCNRSLELFCEQLRRFKPKLAVVGEEEDARTLSSEFPGIEVLYGEEGLKRAAASGSEYDLMVNALMGMRGLAPTLEALKAGKRVALANKESIVSGGRLIMEQIRGLDGRRDCLAENTHLLPIDSEHSAIFQCLRGEEQKAAEKILLTCSGGPFRGATKESLKNVTIEKALAHPKWKMGKKISIDSATLMNKGLEMIEAHWLFDVSAEDIEILVHPESAVHSAVQFGDGSVKAQLATADMRLPISYALGYPERIGNAYERLDLFETACLHFERPNREVFRAIDLAYAAIRAGDAASIALNAANEVLVELFLEGKTGFTDITEGVERILEGESGRVLNFTALEDITSYDKEIREKTGELYDPA